MGRMIRIIAVLVLFCSALWARPCVLRVVHKFPLGTLCSGWSDDGGVACLIDKDKGLFVACHGATHFGVISHSVGGVELFSQEGTGIRCHVVYADWANRVSLLEVVDEDKPLLQSLSEGRITDRLCERTEKVFVSALVSSSPFFAIWRDTDVIDPWVLSRGSPQMFAIPRQASHALGTPVLDAQDNILGIVVDYDEKRTLVVQGRHIAYVLEKWNAGKEPPGFLSSWNFKKDKPNFDQVVGGSTNGLVVADWGPEILEERDYYGCVDLAGLDERFKTFKGYSVQKQRHLGVYRTHRILCSGDNRPIVGDLIWSAWDDDHEVELYGDPLKMLQVIDKASSEGKDFVEWTVLRKDKSRKVRVPLAKGRAATEVVFFGNLACSNEVVPGYDGVVGVHPRWQEAAFFIHSIDGVRVETLEDVKQALKKSGDILGVGAFHTALQWREVMFGPGNLLNTEMIIYYQMATLLARMRVFKKEGGVWREQIA